LWLAFCFCVYFLLVIVSLVVNTSAIDCVERLASEMKRVTHSLLLRVVATVTFSNVIVKQLYYLHA